MQELIRIEDLEREIAYMTGRTLIGMSFSLKKDGWLMMVKVRGKKEQDLVSFIHAATVNDCLHILSKAINTNSITLKWRDDKWKVS